MTCEGTAADAISQEPASIVQMISHIVLQRLSRCANVILSSNVNLDYINNECLLASITITTRSLAYWTVA
jgi:hypothetical protein